MILLSNHRLEIYATFLLSRSKEIKETLDVIELCRRRASGGIVSVIANQIPEIVCERNGVVFARIRGRVWPEKIIGRIVVIPKPVSGEGVT